MALAPTLQTLKSLTNLQSFYRESLIDFKDLQRFSKYLQLNSAEFIKTILLSKIYGVIVSAFYSYPNSKELSSLYSILKPFKAI